MRIATNRLIYVLLFSGLGLFSYILLINNTNLPQLVSEAASSLSMALFFMAGFNALGFSTIGLSNWVNNSYSRHVNRGRRIVLVYGIVATLLFILNTGLFAFAKLLAGAAHPFSFPNGGWRIVISVWLAEMVILGLVVANKSMRNALRLQKRAAKLQQESDKAKYRALQNQLNPHFLFNSLNTLIAEIEYNPANAVDFTRNLSNVYRYVLQCQDKPLVTLSEELEFLDAYLFLHRVRLGQCITSSIDIPAEYNEAMLPPLTLQLLAENVIKHNSITASKPMTLTISVADKELVVSNTVNLKSNVESTGIGLDNLSQRCRLMLGRDISIDRGDELFTVKIPMLYE